MKILSSPVTKTIPLASAAMPKDGCPVDLQLSPNWDAHPLTSPQRDGDALAKRISIATNNLQLGCRIRQEGQNDMTCLGCADGGGEDYRQKLMTTRALNVGHHDVDNVWLCPCLPEGLGGVERHFLTAAGGGLCQGSRSPTPTLQIREYRKSLNVRLGSLKWSLDLVMVVKSRSTPKGRSRSDEKSVGKVKVQELPQSYCILKEKV